MPVVINGRTDRMSHVVDNDEEEQQAQQQVQHEEEKDEEDQDENMEDIIWPIRVRQDYASSEGLETTGDIDS